MADKNLEVALRIKADVADAAKQVGAVGAALDKLGAEGASAAAGLGAAAGAADKAAASLGKDAAAASAAAAANAKLAPAIAQANAAMRAGGLTAGQYSNAMRQLPMQVTDIVTGLASGQSVFMVAIQQGGQLRDAFGGVGPALRALLGTISPMVLVVGAVAGAFAALGKAMLDGYREVQAYDQALISTGNTVGMTSGQLVDLSNRIGDATNQWGDAQTAVTALAASGRISGDVLDTAARAAVSLATLTGQSIEDTTDKIIKLAGAPTKTVEELNGQYHFLSLAVYEQVRALEEQGRTQDAARVAIEQFAAVHERRVQEAADRAGTLERAWRGVKDAVGAAWDGLKSIGQTNIQADLRAAEERLSRLRQLQDAQATAQRNGVAVAIGPSTKDVAAAQAEVDGLRARIMAEQQSARLQAESQARTDKAIAAAKEQRKAEDDWAKIQLANLTRQQRLEEEIATIRKTGAAAGKSEADIEAQIAAARARYAEPTKKAKDTTDQLASAMRSLQDQVLSLGAGALGPVSAIWDRYTKAMSDAQAAADRALKAGGDAGAVQAQVAQVQQLAAQARDRALGDQQRGLQAAYAQAVGDQATAARLQIEQQYGALLADLQRRGDAAGVQLVQSLINVSQARAQLQQLQAQIDRVLGDQSRQEQNIQAEQAAGLVSDYTARQRILALHQQTGAQLDQLLPKYRALAAAIGDPAIIEALRNVEAETARLKLAVNDFQVAFESGFASGLETALKGLADGTLGVRDAFQALADGVTQSLTQIAARALADQAMGAIRKLFGGESATVGQDATKLAAAGGVVTGAAVVLGSSADKLQAAAATLLAANAAGFGLGFAAGGWTGPGGVSQVAGVVHGNEYVQPASRMAEPGALAFMRDFHRQGMASIGAWAVRGYAGGGLVAPLSGVPVPAPAPRPRAPLGGVADAAGGAASAQVGVRVINVVDPALVGDYIGSPDGETQIMNVIARNESRIRQMVGG